MSIDPSGIPLKTKTSPGKRGVDAAPGTPGISNHSSPARAHSALSSPSTGHSRSPFLRRESMPRFPKGFDPNVRRPSLTPSVLSGQSVSPVGSVRGILKHVGEGALDSDSDEDSVGSIPQESGDSEEESGLQPLVSPYLQPRVNPTHPSPLSRVATQEDTDKEEDADEEDSPSPASTDTEESGSEGPRARPSKTRSRSSTLASLPAHARRRSLVKQESSGSMRTVTAMEGSVQDLRELGGGLQREDTVRDLRQGSSRPASTAHVRHKSEALSVLVLDPEDGGGEDGSEAESRVGRHLTEHRRRAVVEEEARIRELGWQALRDAIEQLADEVRTPL